MMRQVSSPVRRGAGRKGRKDLARSLPSFKVLRVLFLGEVSSAFLPSKKAYWTPKFRHLGVDQQYPTISWPQNSKETPPTLTPSLKRDKAGARIRSPARVHVLQGRSCRF